MISLLIGIISNFRIDFNRPLPVNLNLFIWSIIITSILLIGALPILGVAITGLLLDRNISTNSYIYMILLFLVLYLLSNILFYLLLYLFFSSEL